MAQMKNRRIVLPARPAGEPSDTDSRLEEMRESAVDSAGIAVHLVDRCTVTWRAREDGLGSLTGELRALDQSRREFVQHVEGGGRQRMVRGAPVRD